MKHQYDISESSFRGGSLLAYVQKMDQINERNMENLNTLISLAQRAGLTEFENHMKNSVKELEKSNMWVRAAISSVQDSVGGGI